MPKQPSPLVFETFLDAAVSDAPTREAILQYTREEYRRGYLQGQREMKQRAENAIDALRVPDA